MDRVVNLREGALARGDVLVVRLVVATLWEGGTRPGLPDLSALAGAAKPRLTQIRVFGQPAAKGIHRIE